MAAGTRVWCKTVTGGAVAATILEWQCSRRLGHCVCVMQFDDKAFNIARGEKNAQGWKLGTRHLYSTALAQAMKGVCA